MTTNTDTLSKTDRKALWRAARINDHAFMAYLQLTMTSEKRQRFYDICGQLFMKEKANG